jgi:hypothetical protein
MKYHWVGNVCSLLYPGSVFSCLAGYVRRIKCGTCEAACFQANTVFSARELRFAFAWMRACSLFA